VLNTDRRRFRKSREGESNGGKGVAYPQSACIRANKRRKVGLEKGKAHSPQEKGCFAGLKTSRQRMRRGIRERGGEISTPLRGGNKAI